MLYIVTLAVCLAWAIRVARKGKISRHALVSIYTVTLIVVDAGDVAFDYGFNFYDLPTHLLANPASDKYLGIVFSDGMIFPLIAIIICYYVVRYRRPWLTSFGCAIVLGLLEAIYVRFGFMTYHGWNHWLTPAIILIMARILAQFAPRLISYSPPIPYPIRLLCATYAITEWPGALLGGVMHLYKWRLGIHAEPYADDRIAAMALATIMGILAAVLSRRTREEDRLITFLGLGVLSTLLVYGALAVGWLHYNRWNHFWTAVRYITPYFAVAGYDRWESVRR